MASSHPSVIRLVEDAEIHFQLRDGRLHHEGLRVGFPEIDPDLVVSSRGSIGLDETLDLHLELPRLRKDKRKTVARSSVTSRGPSVIRKSPSRMLPWSSI